MSKQGDPGFADLAAIRERLAAVRELLLANAVMFGEIPSPTFDEAARGRFMLDRFIEAGCQSVCTDEVGNAAAIYPGRTGAGNILVSAHLDTVFPATADHTVQVHTGHMTGAGIMDNSLGCAAVATLPLLLEAAGIQLEDNLVLLGTTRSHGRGNIEGMRFFLENNTLPLRAGLLCEGGTLGRMSYESLGMLRGVIEISLPPLDETQSADTVPDADDSEDGVAAQAVRSPLASASEQDGTGAGSQHEPAWGFAPGCGQDHGAIAIITRVLGGILALHIPQKPRTQVILGSVEAGTSFNTRARRGVLRFEVRSEGEGVVDKIADAIHRVVDKVAAQTGTDIHFKVVAQRFRHTQDAAHPYVSAARTVLEQLGVGVRPAPSTGEIEALLAKGIPALTLGLTQGSNRHQLDETIEIEPIFTGLAQVLALLQAIDGGFGDG